MNNKKEPIEELRLLDGVLQGGVKGRYAAINQAVKYVTEIPILEPSDVGKYIRVNVTDDSNITIPKLDNFKVGDTISFEQTGEGVLTVVGATGVTIRGKVLTSGQYAVIQVMKVNINEWIIIGGTE